MFKYTVDYVPSEYLGDGWSVGEDCKPRKYTKEEARKPFNVRLTDHCNMRARDGWRLTGVLPNVDPVSATSGAWLFFEQNEG